MSTSTESANVRIVKGDLLRSRQQTLVNTVNTVGIMGKGIALAFKRRYPEMFDDYVRRCDRGEVHLGGPYPYRADDHLIINFPTKGHWRAVSRIDDIVAGLEHLKAHYQEWGVTSIAVPPLGCGNGQLDWDLVKRVLYRHLSELKIPVELYAPHDASDDQMQLPDLDLLDESHDRPAVEPQWVALVAILGCLEDQPYHWPVGRIFLQKTAYFASQAGLPLGLEWEAKSYGPFAERLKSALARLQNNGLIRERERGRMFETLTGPTYHDALRQYDSELRRWSEAIRRTADLMSRLDNSRAEIAASVHFVSQRLAEEHGRTPYAAEVAEAVERWKIHRRPRIDRLAIVNAIMTLATQGWISVQPDESVTSLEEDFMGIAPAT